MVRQHRHRPGNNTSRTLHLCKPLSANTTRPSTLPLRAWEPVVDRTKNTLPRLPIQEATTTRPMACLTQTCLRLACDRQCRGHYPADTAWPTYTTLRRRHDLILCQKKSHALGALCRRTQRCLVHSHPLPHVHSRLLLHVRSRLHLHVHFRLLRRILPPRTLRDKREALTVFSSPCELSSRQMVARLARPGHTPAPGTPHKGHCPLANPSLHDLLLQTLSSLQAEVHRSVLIATTRSGRTMAVYHPVMAWADPLLAGTAGR
jgi:hypothetical protein